jgi:hypothetical protein
MRQHRRACLGKHGVVRDMVGVVVRVDNEADGQFGALVYSPKSSFPAFGAVSITTTASSPITNPAFAIDAPITAHTPGPSSYMINGRSAWARVVE